MPISNDDEASTSEGSEPTTLEGRLGSLLDAIEGERVPDRLLKLAQALQDELHLRRQRRSPN
ncbi:hypothetical protein LB518_11640 [Mesorhizobium sp. BR1-1-16]|uniref:hypothetical protein n=1 Tax=Mesorhizobium sp. BR1-1-16 TaxID=2876653 RepID=UPI001CCD444C|nr:hypothetical protein [Mesorhizobium sp. BR1-1-16]MBZ9936949.1 hypothetical protein [Mesorhizobium sp. BR1-1-16]